MEGFLDLKMPCWQRHVITRAMALLPALLGIWWLSSGSVGRLLILSQVVLSLQLPFALYPLIRFSSDRALMEPFTSTLPVATTTWLLFALISAANVWLVITLV